MPITIRGEGSIEGLSAGGLPDGSVTAADIADGVLGVADGSITAAKLASGAITTSALPAGTVVQMVSCSPVAYGGYWANQTDWTDVSGLAVTITPESSSSKILISCSVAGETSDSPWDYTFGFTRTVGGTDYMLAHNNGVANQTGNRGKMGITAIPTSYAHTSSNNDSTPEAIQYSFVDAPNTTSAITYTATFNNDNGGNWQLNATQNNTAGSERFVSTIYVMEF